MKNQPEKHQPNPNQKPSQRGGEQVVTKRTYKPRTPITKTYLKIMNDPFVFTV